MTHDDTPRRPPVPTATIPFAPLRPRPPRPVVQDQDDHDRTLIADVEHALLGQPAAESPRRRTRTDIEQVAFWVDHLRHRDLAKICRDITGSDEEARKLIDQIATWAETTVEFALKEGVAA